MSETIAYFSMEIGLDSSIPTYSGGLGILAGDTLRAAADLQVPVVAVTLLHRQGYFCQRLDGRGNQTESPVAWNISDHLETLPQRVTIRLEGRKVWIRAWRFMVRGVSGHEVPVYLLDTHLEENSPWDQTLTDTLYGGDQRYRLCQEAVLGIGGVRMVEALGHSQIRLFHMNEGHSALLAVGLLPSNADGNGMQFTDAIHEQIRKRCVFTTHTPVPAGHDQFPMELARHVLGDDVTAALGAAHCCLDSTLNMTYLALFFSHYVNGVALRHSEISRDMFPGYPINSITNGVHAVTWTAEPFHRLYDAHIPEWRRDNHYLRYAVGIHSGEIQQAHSDCKRTLLAEVKRRIGTVLDQHALTIGFARRATAYKRADLLFSDLDRLRRIAEQVGPLQIIYAGKAHPNDEGGKAMIRRVFQAAAKLGSAVPVVYLEDYDMALAKVLCSGTDVWLNTPQKPQEASGTSGMKAALNGVPSLSVLDGWWVEGHVEGRTGWTIGEETAASDPGRETASVYDKLEHVILPLFYGRPLAFADVRRSTIALNGSFFTAQRMMSQYLLDAYRPVEPEFGLPAG